jgi:hypothetical protein
MDLNEMVEGYIKLRDAKAKIEADAKTKIAPLQALMDEVEGKILQRFQETGIESARTAAGTAYVTTRASVTVADRDTFLKFVCDNEAWDMLENRCKKEAVVQYKTANDDLPPGLNWSEERKVGIRRS